MGIGILFFQERSSKKRLGTNTWCDKKFNFSWVHLHFMQDIKENSHESSSKG